MTHRLLLILVALFFFDAAQAHAKIVRNGDAAPVTHQGVRYEVHSTPKSVSREWFYFQGMWIRATEIITGKVLWDVPVYWKFIWPIIEADTQWAFIDRMSISKGRLIMLNNRDRIYALNLKTKEVRRLK